MSQWELLTHVKISNVILREPIHLDHLRYKNIVTFFAFWDHIIVKKKFPLIIFTDLDGSF